jgi:biopolymer transport protein ExbB/TolQ
MFGLAGCYILETKLDKPNKGEAFSREKQGGVRVDMFSSKNLAPVLHCFAESLLAPVIIGLIGFIIWVLVELGVFVAEFRYRKQYYKSFNSRRLLQDIAGFKAAANGREWWKMVAGSDWPVAVKQIVKDFEATAGAMPEMRQVFARRLLETEEHKQERGLERVELLAKLGPIFGLMGTLIPLGPGLAALGNGDVAALAQAVVIAFDTTVAGLATGSAAFVIAKVRRRWQTVFLADLEVVLEALVEEAPQNAA